MPRDNLIPGQVYNKFVQLLGPVGGEGIESLTSLAFLASLKREHVVVVGPVSDVLQRPL